MELEKKLCLVIVLSGYELKIQSSLVNHAAKNCKLKPRDCTDLNFDFMALVGMKIQDNLLAKTVLKNPRISHGNQVFRDGCSDRCDIILSLTIWING